MFIIFIYIPVLPKYVIFSCCLCVCSLCLLLSFYNCGTYFSCLFQRCLSTASSQHWRIFLLLSAMSAVRWSLLRAFSHTMVSHTHTQTPYGKLHGHKTSGHNHAHAWEYGVVPQEARNKRMHTWTRTQSGLDQEVNSVNPCKALSNMTSLLLSFCANRHHTVLPSNTQQMDQSYDTLNYLQKLCICIFI